jgi:hypothetical protein
MAAHVFEGNYSMSTNQLRLAFDAINSPSKGVAVSGVRRDSRATIVVDRREDIERGENTCNGKTQHPDRKMTSRANPVARVV